MRCLRLSLWLALAAFASVSTGARPKPNFSGVWKLLSADPPQIILIDQNESEVRVFQFTPDHPSVVRGFIEGDSLIFETTGETTGAEPARYLMRLATSGNTISARHATFRETWQKQDPTPRETFLSGFDGRRKLDDRTTDLTGVEGNRLRGWMAHAFNDVAQAERELVPLIGQKTASEFRDEARGYLFGVYARNGLVRKALQYCKPADRPWYMQLAKHPEMSVTRRGDGRIHGTRDPEGRLMLPVVAAGKDSSLLMDTGSNMSLLRMSEAVRLGLKLEPPSRKLTDGFENFEGLLTIVPVLTVGETRMENAPFWVVPDERLEWPGVLGIDLLLKLETLRWNASGETEIGFPGQEKDIRKANLCFWDGDVLIDVSPHAQGGMIFFLDTGTNATKFFPRFAARFPDLVSTGSKLSIDHWTGHGGHRDIMQLTVPEITMDIATFGGVGVVLEKPPGHSERHGVIGMDAFSTAERVTLDLQAMHLTVE